MECLVAKCSSKFFCFLIISALSAIPVKTSHR